MEKKLTTKWFGWITGFDKIYLYALPSPLKSKLVSSG